MKRLGIIGGLGPDATLYYYRTLIDLSRSQLSPGCKHPDQEVVIFQVKQDRCADDMESGRWEAFVERLVEAAVRLKAAGADFAVITSNTPHMVFPEVQRHSPILLLSIVEETCKAVLDRKLKKVGLLATGITMQGGFYQ